MLSACLAGERCRWDGGDNLVPALARLHALGLCVLVCPETMGGLPTPRVPCERRDGRVVARDGGDRTKAFTAGALEALRIARESDARLAVLKARSPSCGVGAVYDGSFSHVLAPGDGVFAAMLREEGLTLATEENFAEVMPELAGPDIDAS